MDDENPNRKIIIIFAVFVLAVIPLALIKMNVSIVNQNADALVQKGNYYFNVGLPVRGTQTGGAGTYDLEKAEKYFKKALEIDSNVPDARHQLARIDFLRYNVNNETREHILRADSPRIF